MDIIMNDLNTQIMLFCKSAEFRKYVNESISFETFLNNLMNDLRIQNMIQTELTSKIPRMVKHEIQSQVPDMLKYNMRDNIAYIVTQLLKETMPTIVNNEAHNVINQKMTEYVSNQLPNYVLKTLADQLPSYLNNHFQMNQILSTHIAYLDTHLHTSAMEIMDKVVNDDKYHQVTIAHLATLDERYYAELSRLQRSADKQLEFNDVTFNDHLEKFQKQVNHKTNIIREIYIKHDLLDHRLKNIEQNYENELISMRHENFVWKFTVGCVVIAGGLFYYFNK